MFLSGLFRTNNSVPQGEQNRKRGRLAHQATNIVFALALVCALTAPAAAAGTAFVPDPKTPYATSFIAKSEGQQWFLEEVERLLNAEQKTLNTINSASDLKNIRALGFDGAEITGQIPAAVGELTELEYLFLGGNHFGGTIPSELFVLPKLRSVDLSGSDYAGAIPDGFGTMPALTSLVLEGNKFTGNVPNTILGNTNIKVLNLKSNGLTGGIPAGISGMTGLEYLNLSDNALGGSIPSLGSLTKLKALSLWRCGLTGSIHGSIYTLADLQILDLALNGLTGEIAADIGDLAELQYLTLANNKIEGEIPDETGDLIKLQKLNLADNRLRGTIPDVFAAATLVEVHLENNYLRGVVPATLKARYDAGALVFLMNNYLTGTVLRNMPNNEKNFADGASSEQYQLISSSTTVRVNEDNSVNVYPQLKNKSLNSGNTTQKVLLNPDEYVLVYDNAKFDVTADANGIHVKALTEVSASENESITIYIKDNDGSTYSRVNVKLTTDVVSSGGGGGSSSEPDLDIEEGDVPLAEKTVHLKYINGYPDGEFKPEKDITREEIAKMVIVALEIDGSNAAVSSYADVSEASWSFAYIEAATERGYMNGYGDGLFGPERSMTRAELAACLVRIAERQGKDAVNAAVAFSDVDAGAWYAKEVATATRLGLVNGYEDGTFRPNSPITRAEAVTMINRMLGRDPLTAEELKTAENPFSDVKTSHWAYWHILEASVEHKH